MQLISENTLNFVVSPSQSGQRLDKFLSEVCTDLSRSRLQKIISDGGVKYNGRITTQASVKVEEGAEVFLNIPDAVPADPQPQDIPLDIFYEDDDLLVVNKPAGLVVHPGAGNWNGTLVNALLYHCGESLSGIGGIMRPGIVHRLDKDTSGLMIVAKNDKTHQGLVLQLSDRTLNRTYNALVLCVPIPLKGSIDLAIGRHRQNRLKMAIRGSGARDAVTHYRVVERFDEACSLVECQLETGRTHQIRVHMEAIGHPLLGDPLYGPQPTLVASTFKKANYSPDSITQILNLPYQMLFAKSIKFIHPNSKKELFFECNTPEIFYKTLKKLK
ncbi:MAG: RluA family pseudouridine synthase [Alphaproteobacteria bacterium]|nr:RluA family pseudouridine synthase [Alphaproteobacteria bacterium]